MLVKSNRPFYTVYIITWTFFAFSDKYENVSEKVLFFMNEKCVGRVYFCIVSCTPSGGCIVYCMCVVCTNLVSWLCVVLVIILFQVR